MSINTETVIKFYITKESIVPFQNIMRKLYETPRIGFNKPFTDEEFEVIDVLAELSGIDCKKQDVQIQADRDTIKSNEYV